MSGVDQIGTVLCAVFVLCVFFAPVALLIWMLTTEYRKWRSRRKESRMFDIIGAVKEQLKADKAYEDSRNSTYAYHKTIAEDQASEKKTRRLSATEAERVLRESTATCHICGKRDFMDNLADVDWLYTEDAWASMNKLFAHPDCAGIRRSDDGKGWTKCKCKK